MKDYWNRYLAWILAVLILLGLLVVLNAGVAAAQQLTSCAPRDVVLERLAQKYGEDRQYVGLAGPNRIVETFASEETGTWTIIVTGASGVSCLVASGSGFEHVAEAARSKGEAL